MLELVARVPYQAWEQAAYIANADFEDHAEHEYAHLVAEQPEWETKAFVSHLSVDFAEYTSLADGFRQIGHDERVHKLSSEARLHAPRFR